MFWNRPTRKPDANVSVDVENVRVASTVPLSLSSEAVIACVGEPSRTTRYHVLFWKA